MSKFYREITEISKFWYTVIIEKNDIFLVLDSLEFRCVPCQNNQFVDLTPVPPGRIAVNCGNCPNEIMTLEEDDFKIQLIPADEVYESAFNDDDDNGEFIG